MKKNMYEHQLCILTAWVERSLICGTMLPCLCNICVVLYTYINRYEYVTVMYVYIDSGNKTLNE